VGAFPTGSPRDLIRSVADGFTNFSVMTLRKFQPQHFKVMLQNITVLEREIRGEVVEESDFEATRKKHFRLQNLNRARIIIQEFIRHRRIKMD
jgi:hypothetical protein